MPCWLQDNWPANASHSTHSLVRQHHGHTLLGHQLFCHPTAVTPNKRFYMHTGCGWHPSFEKCIHRKEDNICNLFVQNKTTRVFWPERLSTWLPQSACTTRGWGAVTHQAFAVFGELGPWCHSKRATLNSFADNVRFPFFSHSLIYISSNDNFQERKRLKAVSIANPLRVLFMEIPIRVEMYLLWSTQVTSDLSCFR